jgi:nucleoside phosphorylase
MHKLKANKIALESNYALIVTTNTPERDAVVQELDAALKLTTGSTSKRAYLGMLGNVFVVVLDGSGGYSDPNSASRLVQAYLADPAYPRPFLVVPVGICWGNPAHVARGDVVVATRIVSANRMTETDGQRDPTSYNFHSSVDAERVLELADGARLGALLSMETRLSSQAGRDEWIRRFPFVLGGEMEAFSIAPTCQDLPWIIVKGVSDFGTSQESRDAQPVVASKAMGIAKHLIEGLLIDEDSPPNQAKRKASLVLAEALHGRHISIELSDLDDDINRSLFPFFVRVEAATRVHTAALAVSSDLARDVARLIIEVASNAFRHGRARSVAIEFDARELRYMDDANAFSVESLSEREADGRGGRSTYMSFVRTYINSEKVALECVGDDRGNLLRIGMSPEIPELPRIAFRCSAVVDYQMLRQRGEVLKWEDECEEIFIDFDSIAVTSIILDLCEELVRPIEEGKRFVILCSDADTIDAICSRYPDQVSRGDIRFIPPP